MGTTAISQVLAHIRTPLYRNGYALILSSAATSILGLVYWVLAARFYPAEVVGLNSAVLSAMMFLGGVAQLSLNNVLVRFIPTAGPQTFRLAGLSYLTSLAASGLGTAIFLIGIDLWAPALKFMQTSPGWSLNFLLAVMAWCIFALQDSILIGLRQAIWVPLENILFAVVKIGLLLVLALPLQQAGIFISWTIPVLVSLLPVNLLIFLRLIPGHVRHASGQADPIQLSKIIKYTSGNYLGTLFFLASTTLLPVIVTNQAGPSANAYFYPAWTIAAGLQFIANNLSISLTVEASANPANLVLYSRRFLIQTARLLAPAVIVILFGAQLILSAFGTLYAEQGALLLRLLALGTLPNVLVNFAISLARVQNRPGVIVLIQGGLAVLILGLSFLFLPIFGINGVGFAWIASQSVLAVILALTELKSTFLL